MHIRKTDSGKLGNSSASSLIDSQYNIFETAYDEEISAQELSDSTELHKLFGFYLRSKTHLTNEEKISIREALSQFKTQSLEKLGKLPRFTLLLDNSGSMRGRPIINLVNLVDIFVSECEKIGIETEILGFTTKAWKGGRSREDWLKGGRPRDPGRLNDVRHIIYKSFEASHDGSKENLGLMLREGLLKENIDGEALEWAYKRSLAQSEGENIIIQISDGAPVDDSTLSINKQDYLTENYRKVTEYVRASSDVDLYLWDTVKRDKSGPELELENGIGKFLVQQVIQLQVPEKNISGKVDDILKRDYANREESFDTLEELGINSSFDMGDISRKLKKVTTGRFTETLISRLQDMDLEDHEIIEVLSYSFLKRSVSSIEVTLNKILQGKLIEKWTLIKKSVEDVSFRDFCMRKSFEVIHTMEIDVLTALIRYDFLGNGNREEIEKHLTSLNPGILKVLWIHQVPISDWGKYDIKNLASAYWYLNEENSSIFWNFYFTHGEKRHIPRDSVKALKKIENLDSESLNEIQDFFFSGKFFSIIIGLHSNDIDTIKYLKKVSIYMKGKDIDFKQAFIKNISLLVNSINSSHTPKLDRFYLHNLSDAIGKIGPVSYEILEYFIKTGNYQSRNLRKIQDILQNSLGNEEKKRILALRYAQNIAEKNRPLRGTFFGPNKEEALLGEHKAQAYVDVEDILYRDIEALKEKLSTITTFDEQIKIADRFLDMFMDVELLKKRYPEIINPLIQEFEGKASYSVSGKKIDWKKIGGVIGMMLMDTTHYMYQTIKHQRELQYKQPSQDKLKILYRLMKRCIGKGAFFFKDSGQIELLGEFLKYCTILENELGIIDETILKRRGISEEELAIVSQVFPSIVFETLERGEFDTLYRNTIKVQHPDKGTETHVAQAINRAREIVYRIKGWK